MFFILGIIIFAFAPGQWTPAWIVNHDKFSHMMVFFLLGFMMVFSFPRMKMFMLLSFLVFFAVLIEFLQFSFFNRGFSVDDILYVFIGIGLFLSSYFSFTIYLEKQFYIFEKTDD